jgi:hypothetical protein
MESQMRSQKSDFVRRVLQLSLMSCVLTASLSFGTLAKADANASADPAPADPAPAAPAEAKPAPPRYSLPWLMRPVAAGNVVKVDMAFAFSKARDTQPILFLGSYKVRPNLALIARFGFIHNTPVEGESATAFVNPAVGALYAIPISKNIKASLFAAATIPIGQGGGNKPNLAQRAANIPSGIFARASMDNALFQINYLTPMVGADIAYVGNDMTLQFEATLLQLMRVRGEEVDKDPRKTNLVFAAHAGYFLLPQLSFGVELRYQYWASNPALEKMNNPDIMDHWTLGFGPRAHIKLNEKMWLRPGVSLTMGLDLPTGFAGTGLEYKIVQVDVPFFF